MEISSKSVFKTVYQYNKVPIPDKDMIILQETADGFTVSPKGYRYADYGIYLSMNVIINIPVEMRKKHPAGYEDEIGLAVRMRCMFVTDKGNARKAEYSNECAARLHLTKTRSGNRTVEDFF